jgi:hypothetical protein
MLVLVKNVAQVIFVRTVYVMWMNSVPLTQRHGLLSPYRIFLMSDLALRTVPSIVAIIAHRLGHESHCIVGFSWHQEFEVKIFKLILNILKTSVLLIVGHCSHFELSCNCVACETTSKYIYM